MRSQRRSAIATGLVIVALSFGGRASAQPNDAKAAAEVLFQAGQRLLSEGKVESACAKFEESERLDHALGTMLNIANCYEKSGRTASAWAMYREVANLAQTKHDTSREGFATSHAEGLTSRLSTLTIVVPENQNPEGLVIRRDGVQIGQALWGMPTPADPGDHKIEVSAPGRRTWTTIVKVEADASKSTVNIPQLEQEAAAPVAAPIASEGPREPEAGRDDSSTQRTIGVVVAGVGVVGIGIGAAFGLAAKSKYSDALSHCQDTHCNAEGLSLIDGAKGAATASTVAFVIGGAAVATGAVLYFTAPKGSRVKVAPAVGPRTAGVAIGGAW